MPISLTCPSCKVRLRVPDNLMELGLWFSLWSQRLRCTWKMRPK